MITLYTTPKCTRCAHISYFLSSNDINFNKVEVGRDISVDSLSHLVGRDVRAVPVIIDDGTEITEDQLVDYYGF